MQAIRNVDLRQDYATTLDCEVSHKKGKEEKGNSRASTPVVPDCDEGEDCKVIT